MSQFNEMVQSLQELQASATPEAVKGDAEEFAKMFNSMIKLFIAAAAVIEATPNEHLPKAEMAKFMETALMVFISMSCN